MDRFRDRGALLRQIALEARNAAVRDRYLELLAEWEAPEANPHSKKISRESEKYERR